MSNRPFGSQPQRPTDSGAPGSKRARMVERVVAPERLPADRMTSFSRAAEAHRVAPTAIDALLEQLPTGVLLVDRDGRVVYSNAAARALRVDRLEPLQWAVMRALLTEDAVREDEIVVDAPGQPRRLLSARVMPVRVAGFGVNAALVTISDVTARELVSAWNPMIERLVNL